MRRHELILFRSPLSEAGRIGLRTFAAITLVASSVLTSVAYGPFIGLTTFFAFFTMTVLLLAFSVTVLK